MSPEGYSVSLAGLSPSFVSRAECSTKGCAADPGPVPSELLKMEVPDATHR